jgi:hypothetical protein
MFPANNNKNSDAQKKKSTNPLIHKSTPSSPLFKRMITLKMKKSFVNTTICIFAIATVSATTNCEGFDVHYYVSQQLPSPTLPQQQYQRSHNNQRNVDTTRRKNNLYSFHGMIGRRILPMQLAAKSQNPSQDSASPPSNEFSRRLQADRILRTRKSTTGVSNSFYPVSIEASDLECVALARRFDLSSISNLSATLQLRPSSLNTGGISSNSIEVEGLCKSIVTQRCVRTNEDFEVTVEFPIYCIVRPVIPTNNGVSPQLDESSTTGSYQDMNGMNDRNSAQQPRKSNGASKNKKSYRLPDRNIDEMDVMELQRMLQADINSEDDTLMEDEAIYNLQDGQLDVGELVAQLFWFKLDPYPKKPGTDPIQRSITG